MPEQQNIEYKQSWHDDYLKQSSLRPNYINQTAINGYAVLPMHKAE